MFPCVRDARCDSLRATIEDYVAEFTARVDGALVDLSFGRAGAVTTWIARATPEFRTLVGTATRCANDHCGITRRAVRRINADVR